MKILLINNHTQHLDSLNESLAGFDVEIQSYKPGIKFNYQDKDLVILSGGGGEGLEIYDEVKPGKYWYADQINFVLECDKPILGICMGFEIICRAHDAEIKHMGKLLEGYCSFSTNSKGHKYLGKKNLEQFEAHEWCVPSIPSKDIEVLAKSETGVEIIKHKSRKIFATQFHPEMGGTLNLRQLILQLSIT